MLRPWHLALPVLAQLCWRQHIWFNLWHCEMSTKFATLCMVECGQLSKNLQESLIVFSCQIVLHALTVWCLFMTCTFVFQRIWITLGGPQSASAADVRSFWLCQVPPQQNRWTSPPFDSSIPTFGLFAGKELFWSKTEWLKLWQTVQKTSKRSPEFTWILRQWDFFICRHLLERRSVWRSSVTSSRKSLETSMKMSWSKFPSIQVSYNPRWICYPGDSPICPTRSWHVLELFSRMASWMLAAWEIF